MHRILTTAGLAAALWLLTTWSATADVEAKANLGQIDSQFICPEALPTDDARNSALHGFAVAFAKAEPNAAVADMLLFRRALLAKHGCRKTLQSLNAADRAVEAGKDVQVQAWLPVASVGDVSLAVSTDHLRLVLDPRFPEQRAVSAFVKLTFVTSRETSATHIRYEQVISHAIFYCESDRYALVENDYFLGQSEVLRDASRPTTVHGAEVYPVEPVPAQSFNAFAARWACGNASGRAA